MSDPEQAAMEAASASCGAGPAAGSTDLDGHASLTTGAGAGEAMAARVAACDWSSTPLGTADDWPRSLRTAVAMLLAAPVPMALWWGPELTFLYNDAYAPFLGPRHPWALGRSARQVWAEVWPKIAPRVEAVMRRGESVSGRREHFVLERHGTPEDAWFTWSYSPVPDDAGGVGGLLNVAFEETASVLAEAARQAGEARLRALVTTSGAVLYRMSADWSELLPLDGKGLVASNDTPIRDWLERNIPASEHAAVRERSARCIATRTPFEMEHRVYRPDRSIGWTRSRAVPVLDASGAVIEWVGTAEDVTERRRVEAALHERDQRLRAVFEQTEAGIAQVDLTGRFVLANERYARIVGRSREELRDLRMQDITHPDDLPRNLALFRQAIVDGTPFVIEKRYVRPDGAQVWVSNRISLLRDDDGKPSGVIAATMDITDRKRAEAALRSSEARYRELFESIDQGFCVIEMIRDADGRPTDYRFLEANPAFARHTGLVDAVGRTARELVPGLEDRWVQLYDRVARTGEAARFQENSDPMGRWFDVYAARTGDPAALRVALLFTDITESKRAEADLQTSEERLRLAVAIAGMGTFEIDLRTDAVTVNEEGRRMYGWPAGEPLTFAKVQSHFHPDDRDWVNARVADALRPDGPGEFELEQRIIRTDGVTRWIRVRGRAVPGAAGGDRGPGRLVGTYLDVTEEKEAQRERERLLSSERAARAEAERAGRMKDEFLATLSHELRTPLNAILGWSQLLAAGGSTGAEDLAEGLRTIERNARAQTQIIEDLLDMSRIVSGKVRLDVQRVDLGEVVRLAVETARPSAVSKGITLGAVLDPHAGPVAGDPHRLQQVCWNLLSNAIKFTPEGGRVQVLLQRVNSQVRISVSDTGEGISAEFLPHVFDRFRQADATTTRKHGGLGLGLSIVKQLVELHGGSVHANSPGAGRGSTFTVALPLTAVHRESTSGEPRPKGLAAPLERDCAQLPGTRVLVVDDEPDARALVKRLLEACGAQVVTAGSAAEALRLLRAHPSDVLVSDVGMPGEDGYSLIRQVRHLAPAAGGQVPAIALTAYARAEDRVKAITAGFDLHLAKPVEPVELVAMVASLAMRRAHDAAVQARQRGA